MAETSKKSIEEMFDILDETITNLEKEDLSLDKAFSLYEEGMKMVKNCEEELDLVEKKVLEISGGITREFS